MGREETNPALAVDKQWGFWRKMPCYFLWKFDRDFKATKPSVANKNGGHKDCFFFDCVSLQTTIMGFWIRIPIAYLLFAYLYWNMPSSLSFWAYQDASRALKYMKCGH